ncbi:MAG TPA: YggT family protein [Nitrospirales bacterium]|jgi:YggT family protein|nr:YggT family protein [Nitrospirales bacterium]
MFVAGNFLTSLAVVLHLLLQTYMWVVIVRALLSWVNPDPWNPIVQTLNRLTDPLLEPIRRKMFRMMGSRGVGIDVSPLILIAGIYFLDYFVVETLNDIGRRLR